MSSYDIYPRYTTDSKNVIAGGSVGGGAYKAPCRLASTADVAGTYSASALTLTVTATGLLSIDSVNVAVGNRVLLKNQTTGAEKGIYVVTVKGATGVSAVLTRASDCNTSGQFVPGMIVAIAEGTVNADTFFEFSSDAPFVMDTDAGAWAAAPL